MISRLKVVEHLEDCVLEGFELDDPKTIGSMLRGIIKRGVDLTIEEWEAVRDGLKSLRKENGLYTVTCIGVVNDILSGMRVNDETTL